MDTVDLKTAVHRWIKDVFFQRLYKGHSLIKDPDGRYRPGPKPPRVVQMEDGTVIPYSRESRHQFTQEEQNKGRTHLALVELDRIRQTLQPLTPPRELQLLILILRRLFEQSGGERFNERIVRSQLAHLMRLAASPVVQWAIVEELLQRLIPRPAPRAMTEAP